MPTKVLITVKTYPSLSNSYQELVCTAGIKEDGSWVRIYPIPFRRLEYEQRYKKYQWIELELRRNESDPRPESYKPVNINQIALGEFIDTENGTWRTRKEKVLQKIYTNMAQLIEEAKNSEIGTSLAIFKPTAILEFTCEEDDREWDSDKLALIEQQTNLFENAENPFHVVDKVPYKFKYRFLDDQQNESHLMIDDWEIGMLFGNCLKKHNGDEVAACEDVKSKYYDNFALTKDLHFFLGTTRQYHSWARNPFIIIGTFYPPIEVQTELPL